MTYHAWIRDKVVMGALATLVLIVAVGAITSKPQLSQQELEVAPQPTPEMYAAVQPPVIEITVSHDADWDKPQSIPEPKLADTTNETVAQLKQSIARPNLAALRISTIPTFEDEEDNVETDQQPFQLTPVGSTAPDTLKDAGNGNASEVAPFEILDATIQGGQLVRTNWAAGEALHGAQIPTPVLIAHGTKPGPTLCVTAAVHGDELNGIESVRQLMYSIKPEKLKGTLIGVPIVNLQGFQRHSRYLSDRRDLNRFFPGNPRGSSASRMAHSFFTQVIQRCNGLVDLHTGSFHRTNLPQLRADLKNADVLALTQGFGSTVILHSSGGGGTLRKAAVEAGIPAVTLEAGEPLRLQEDAVKHTVKALFTLLDTMHMYDKRSLWGNPEPAYYSSAWIRADQGGILMSGVKLGKRVKPGDLLGTVTDPISNEQTSIFAPYAGRVIGMALNQFVMPGYATFHLATTTELDELQGEEHFHAEGMDIAISDSQARDESEE